MAEQSVFQTGRRKSTDGYTLLEMMLVLAIVSLLARTAFSFRSFTSQDFHLFPSRLVLSQSRALVSGIPESMDPSVSENSVIRFNENASINQARTISWPDAGGRKIVLELGTGSLDVRE